MSKESEKKVPKPKRTEIVLRKPSPQVLEQLQLLEEITRNFMPLNRLATSENYEVLDDGESESIRNELAQLVAQALPVPHHIFLQISDKIANSRDNSVLSLAWNRYLEAISELGLRPVREARINDDHIDVEKISKHLSQDPFRFSAILEIIHLFLEVSHQFNVSDQQKSTIEGFGHKILGYPQKEEQVMRIHRMVVDVKTIRTPGNPMTPYEQGYHLIMQPDIMQSIEENPIFEALVYLTTVIAAVSIPNKELIERSDLIVDRIDIMRTHRALELRQAVLSLRNIEYNVIEETESGIESSPRTAETIDQAIKHIRELLIDYQNRLKPYKDKALINQGNTDESQMLSDYTNCVVYLSRELTRLENFYTSVAEEISRLVSRLDILKTQKDATRDNSIAMRKDQRTLQNELQVTLALVMNIISKLTLFDSQTRAERQLEAADAELSAAQAELEKLNWLDIR